MTFARVYAQIDWINCNLKGDLELSSRPIFYFYLASSGSNIILMLPVISFVLAS